jgi:hypothetical protein
MWGRSPEEAEIPNVREAYEQGKHRRYSLLFAVNGGAFAVARLFTEPKKIGPIIGYLTLWQISLGLALFTIVMVLDIFMFGQNMRKVQEMRDKRPALGLFGWQGKLVLILIGGLLVTGWTLVSFDRFLLLLLLIIYLDSIELVYLLDQTKDEHTISESASRPWYLRYPRLEIVLSVAILIFTAGLVVAVVSGVFVL